MTSYPARFFAASQPNTALDMINLLPGFTFDPGDSVRGFGGAAGNVLIDGERPASKNDGLDQILQRIPAGQVLRIEVIRGGAPGVDMHGKTIIANVIRVHDDGLKVTAALSGTTLQNGVLDYGARLEGSKRSGDTLFEAGILAGTGGDDGTGNGPRIDTDGQGHITQTGFERTFGNGANVKGTAAVETPLWGGRVRLEGSLLSNPYEYTNDDDLLEPPGHEFERYRQNADSGEVGLRYTRAFGSRASLEVYALQQLRRYASDDRFTTDTDVSTFTLGIRGGESILRGTWKWTAASNLSMEAGAEGDFNWQTSRTAETDAGLPIVVPAANVRVTELRGELYADATWQARRDLAIEAGIRVEASSIASTGDVVSSDRFAFPKPRFVATWSPDASDQWQLRLEREVSQLDFGDFTASGNFNGGLRAGNPTLTPQQDWVIEASYDHRFWGSGEASLALRRYWLTDVIDNAPTCAAQSLLPDGLCDPDAEFDGPANIGSGTREEIAATLTLPTDRFGLKSGLLTGRATWRFSQVTDPSTHEQRPISGLHPLDAELHFTQGLAKLKSTWGWDFFSAWTQTNYRFNEIDVAKLGLWLDVYYEYKPRPDLSLKFEADNLTSHGVTQIREFYDPFRDVNGGVLASIDARYPRFSPEFTVRIRKTFG